MKADFDNMFPQKQPLSNKFSRNNQTKKPLSPSSKKLADSKSVATLKRDKSSSIRDSKKEFNSTRVETR